MHRIAIASAAALGLLLSGGLAAQEAPEAPRNCRIHQNGQWQDVGSGSATSCLKAVDRWVGGYNEGGFKFGVWSRLMLAVDVENYYHSEDGGRSWQLIGRKADLRKATELAAELAGPGAGAAQAEATPVGRTRSCSIQVQDGWRVKQDLRLEQCIAELQRSQAGAPGFRYGYWSGVFLAVGPDGVLRSDDGLAWAAWQAARDQDRQAPGSH